jgi:hypothetical protein
MKVIDKWHQLILTDTKTPRRTLKSLKARRNGKAEM